MSQLETTNRLVELTLSQINELSFEKRLFRIAEILPGNGTHPLLFGDSARFARAFSLIREEYPGEADVRETAGGLEVSFSSREPVAEQVRSRSGMLLAEKIIVLQYGEFRPEKTRCRATLPWPNLAGLPPLRFIHGSSRLLALGGSLPPDRFPFPVTAVEPGGDPAPSGYPDENILLAWNPDGAGIEEWLRVYALRHHPQLFRAPFLCYGESVSGSGLLPVIEDFVRKRKRGPVVVVGTVSGLQALFPSVENTAAVSSMDEFFSIAVEVRPSLVVFGEIDIAAITAVRNNPETVLVPVLVLPDRIGSDGEIAALCGLPRIVLCNRGVAGSPEFASRVRAVADGDEILPPHTGALVKKAILYLNLHAPAQIARWKLADTVHVSDDYLTRIFHKEMGLSIWEYLNRYRISLACELLLHTNESIYEIALRTGFQDQAYFCRVFKKIHGMPPGKLRSRS